ncbi:MAG: hypothetical protein IJI44_05425 [Erysipelotrichaceae bacterium]|nr:hypothetical protein [Erysipelotrichaceae bacterium]
MNIDIEKLKQIREELDRMSENDILFVTENNVEKYAIVPIELYDAVEDMFSSFSEGGYVPQVKIASNQEIELSYDEYERIKEQILEAVEKTLMPKPEKLN